MKQFICALLFLLPCTAQTDAFVIPDGDVVSLESAIKAAADLPGTSVIELAPAGTYEDVGGFTRLEINSDIVIKGNGATLSGHIRVADDANLAVSDVVFRGPGEPVLGTFGESSALSNAGTLYLNRVVVVDQASWGVRTSSPAMLNYGYLEVRNSTFASNFAGSNGGVFGGTIRNFSSGIALVDNSTLIRNQSIVSGSAITNEGLLLLRNTILTENTLDEEPQNCDFTDPGGTFISLGGNIDSDGTCGLDHPTDQTGIDPMLLPLANNEGFVPAPTSPAVNAAVNGPRVDQLGRHRTGKRDSGAIEANGVIGQSIAAWATGTWHSHKSDGHYFVVEVIGDDLVVGYWLAYDANGNQRWMYGVGKADGSRVFLEAYTSEGMRAPNFEPRGRVQTAWGVVELHFRDCNSVWAEWHTGEPGFVADTTPLRRLTSIAGNPCPVANEKGFEKINDTARWTGTWHVPAQDGHFFVVEGINNDTVLVYWLTYDESGSPAWVYAVGSPVNGVLGADVFISEGMTAPEFNPDELDRRLWGTLEFEFKNCSKAFADWEPSEPGFHPGSATLRRLTTVTGLGCG